MKSQPRHFKTLLFVCFCFSFGSLANHHLDRAQSVYFEGVDEFVVSQIKNVFARYSHLLQDTSQKSFMELARYGAQIEKSLACGLSNTTTGNSYKAIVRKQQKLRQNLAQVADALQNANDETLRLMKHLSRLDQQNLCATSVPFIQTTAMPRYALNENIHVATPPPQRKNVKLWIGSENERADTFEKSLYLPATTGGCATAQAFLPFLPIVGCLIGAAVGATAAYIVGKVGSVMITEHQNFKDSRSYEALIYRQRKKQEQQITEARQWINEHPIDRECFNTRAMATCLSQPFAWKQNILAEVAIWFAVSQKAASTLDVYAEQLEIEQANLKKETAINLQAHNARIVKSRMGDIKINRNSSEQEETALNNLRRFLGFCLLEKSESCAGMTSCVQKTQHEFDGLTGPKATHFKDELNLIEKDLIDCNSDMER